MHTSLVDYFMATSTFQTWFHRCSIVSYCGPLLLRSQLVVTGKTTDKRVLIPIYEMSTKEIEGYIKCFDVNVQTWVIIVRADQVQGALRSQLQRHGSCLHRLDKGAKISLRKGWWQTGKRTKIKGQQSHENWVSKSLENERAFFQASDIESNLRWTPDRINASPCLQRYLDALPSGDTLGKVIRW